MSSEAWGNLEAVGGNIPETQFFEGDSAFSSLGLTRAQRLSGFVVCYIVGMFLSVLGPVTLFVTFGFPVIGFAVFYSLGTVVSLIGTGFLIGFGKQLKLMFKPVRVVATVVFLGMIIVIIIVTCTLDFAILSLIFIMFEYLAFLWYALSYIPNARSAVLRKFGFADGRT